MTACQFALVPVSLKEDAEPRLPCDQPGGVSVRMDGLVAYTVCLDHAVYLFCADTENVLAYGTPSVGMAVSAEHLYAGKHYGEEGGI